MMRFIIKIITVFFISTYSISACYAQSMYGDAAKADVKVNYVHSLEEAKKIAKKEKKLIFFNCFADWATPCHSMNKLVFSDQAFGDYLNKTFVNLILDLSYAENIPIKDKYKVRFFAHYLILDADGEVVHRIARGFPLPAFKEKVQRSLSSKTSLAGMEKEYEKGNRTAPFLRDYFGVLSDAGYDQAGVVRSMYINKIPKSDMAKKENWEIFTGLALDVNDEWFTYFKENKNLFIKNNGEKIVKDFAASRYSREALPFISSTIGFSDDQMTKVLNGLKSFDLDSTNDAYVYYNLAYKRNRSTVADFVSYLEKHGSIIHPTIATGIDVSLKNMVNVTEPEKKLITDYLTKRMDGTKGSSAQMYQTAIKELKKENGIIFEDGEFQKSLNIAKKQNKLIFLDAYTTWCGPCKMMAQQVFTLDTVGKYFNSTFVNHKMDMESGEGPKWAKNYKIEVYPTFLLINGDGELVHKITGAHRPIEFMQLIAKGNVRETSYSYLKNEYASGNRSPLFINNYVSGMVDAGEIRDAGSFIETYYNGLSKADKQSVHIWPLVQKYGASMNSPMLSSIINNKDLFNSLLSDSTFLPAIERVYVPTLYLKISKGEKNDDYQKAKKDLSVVNLPGNSTLSNMLKIEKFVDNSDYNGLISFYQQSVFNMSDDKGKMNLDLLWKSLFLKLNEGQKEQVITYLKKQYELADSRALNSYTSLLDSLL